MRLYITALLLLLLGCGTSSNGDLDVSTGSADLPRQDAGSTDPDTRPVPGNDASTADVHEEVTPAIDDLLVDVAPAKKINLASDADRDGVVSFDLDDEKKENQWSLKGGAVYLVNVDDDDGDGLRDCDDEIVNGTYDTKDLALILVEPMPWLDSDASVHLAASQDAVGHVRLFRNLEAEWVPVDLTTGADLTVADLSGPVVFGLEGLHLQFEKGFSGLVRLTLTVSGANGAVLGEDEVQLGPSPVLLTNNLNLPSLLVTGYSAPSQAAFVAALEALAQAPGYEVAAVGDLGLALPEPLGEDIFAQDGVEIAFATLPRGQDPHVIHYALKAPRGEPMDEAAVALLSAGTGWCEPAQPRLGAKFYDAYANLELTPPLLANEMYFPYGRLYAGYDPAKESYWTLHPDLAEFLEAQGIQGPIVYVDTSWLHTGHVSELVSFVPFSGDPGCCGKGFRMIMPDPGMTIDLLAQLVADGHTEALLFEGTPAEITVGELMMDQGMIDYNFDIGGKLAKTGTYLRGEFDLEEEELVGVPALFAPDPVSGERTVHYLPSLVNGLVLGKAFVTADPHGPVIDGVDVIKELLETTLEPYAVDIHYIDTWNPYHEHSGGVHRATQAHRLPHNLDWWLWYM